MGEKASENKEHGQQHSRRSNKPLMEKRRRARINESLGQLKALVLEASKKDTTRHSKLEKADILEMTVKYLKNLHRQQSNGPSSKDSDAVSKYRAGYNECVKQVTQCLGGFGNLDSGIQTRVLQHLSSCLERVNVVAPVGVPDNDQKLSHAKGRTETVSSVRSGESAFPPTLYPANVTRHGIDAPSNARPIDLRTHAPQTFHIVPGTVSTGNYAVLVAANQTFTPLYLDTTSMPRTANLATVLVARQHKPVALTDDNLSVTEATRSNPSLPTFNNQSHPRHEQESQVERNIQVVPPVDLKIDDVWRPW